MKRSEMIEKIAENIILGEIYMKDAYKSRARTMLKAIEEAGMLPPLVKQDFLDSDNQDYAFMSEWEPESKESESE